MSADRSRLGRQSRRFGHDHERWVASEYRRKWPSALVERGWQSHRAWNPDVRVAGDAPELAIRLWTECQVAAEPNPYKKLEQAERDVRNDTAVGVYTNWLPLVVWRRKRERTVWATMRGATWMYLVSLSDLVVAPGSPYDMVVTVRFADLLSVLP